MLIILSKNKLTLNSNGIYLLDDFCKLKNIETKNNVLVILDLKIEEDGIINNFYFEEIIISIDLKIIISNIVTEKLKEICLFYNIKLLEI